MNKNIRKEKKTNRNKTFARQWNTSQLRKIAVCPIERDFFSFFFPINKLTKIAGDHNHPSFTSISTSEEMKVATLFGVLRRQQLRPQKLTPLTLAHNSHYIYNTRFLFISCPCPTKYITLFSANSAMKNPLENAMGNVALSLPPPNVACTKKKNHFHSVFCGFHRTAVHISCKTCFLFFNKYTILSHRCL